VIFQPVVPVPGDPDLALYRSGRFLLGHTSESVGERDLTGRAQRLYERVLSACRERHLYRIWNYVPGINVEVGGLENYRAFCKGRSLAFESAFGGAFQPKLPAASAVGSDGQALHVIFVAGEMVPRHVENPEQVPAYQYPPEYGPRSPSFSRATRVSEAGRDWIYVSGTAAIKGHATMAPGSLAEQIDCTLDNLRLISRSCEIGGELGAGAGWKRSFKIYLRRTEDYAAAAQALQEKLIRPGDSVSYLRADICRAELKVEIEATLNRG
jgi:enamine deaminase RidA (YjgF/YER057c/UK114 family)